MTPATPWISWKRTRAIADEIEEGHIPETKGAWFYIKTTIGTVSERKRTYLYNRLLPVIGPDGIRVLFDDWQPRDHDQDLPQEAEN